MRRVAAMLGVWSQHVMAWGLSEDFRFFLTQLPYGFERSFEAQGFELFGVVVGEQPVRNMRRESVIEA